MIILSMIYVMEKKILMEFALNLDRKSCDQIYLNSEFFVSRPI